MHKSIVNFIEFLWPYHYKLLHLFLNFNLNLASFWHSIMFQEIWTQISTEINLPFSSLTRYSTWVIESSQVKLSVLCSPDKTCNRFSLPRFNYSKYDFPCHAHAIWLQEVINLPSLPRFQLNLSYHAYPTSLQEIVTSLVYPDFDKSFPIISQLLCILFLIIPPFSCTHTLQNHTVCHSFRSLQNQKTQCTRTSLILTLHYHGQHVNMPSTISIIPTTSVIRECPHYTGSLSIH